MPSVILWTPSLVDTLAYSVIRTRPILLIRTWDSHTAINRLLTNLPGRFESRKPGKNRQQLTLINMPEQEAPRQQLTMGSVPNAIDYSPRTVPPQYFVPATWKLLSAEGRLRYSNFVELMIRRIQRNECTWLEVREFVHLVATEHNWDFMNLAMPHLPSLDVRQ